MKTMLLWIVLAVAVPAMARAQEPPRPLDVHEAVRLALQQNYAYLRAAADVGVAEGNRLDAIAGLLPSAVGEYAKNKQHSEQTYPDLNQATNSTLNSSGFGASVREDLSLFSWYRYRSAQAGVSQARHGKEAAAQDLAFRVRQQFYLVLRAQELLRVQEEDLRLAQDQERRTTSMFELGSVARVDVLKAKVRVSDAEVALIRQENQVDIETAQLATLLGLNVEPPLQLSGELKADVVPVDSAQAIRESASRPDVLSAQENLRSLANLHRAAVLSRVPGLFATFDANTGSGDSEVTQLISDTTFTTPKTDVEFDQWSARIGASVALDALFNTGQVKRAGAIKRQAEYDLRGLELEVQREVQQAVLNERAALKAIDAAQRGVESAEEDLRLSQERYQQGLGTVLELLEAQVNLTRARDSLVNALTVLKISEAALDRARGAPLPY